jgi:hypothetical protein
MPTRMIVCALIAVLAMLTTPLQVWAAPPPPTLTLTADPPEVTVGDATTLTWRSTRTRSCTASWAGARPTSGSETRTVNNTTTFTLACTGNRGMVTQSVTVMVTDTPPPPPLPSVLTLTWTDNAATEDGFLVERLTNGTWTVIATLDLDTETYQDGPLTAGTTYCYRVAAFNLAGPSGYSNEACKVAP